MENVNKVPKMAMKMYNEAKEDEHGRYRSWEYCYKAFSDARKETNPDVDYLSLNLAFYLASWGMYRGSSFLLQKDYKVHVPVVKKILEKKYDVLFGIECEKLADPAILGLIFELDDFMCDYYREVRSTVANVDIANDVSSILITKILMGTLGCVPAYDRFFKSGLAIEKAGIQKYGKKSLLKLVDFYKEHYDVLEEARQKMEVVPGLLYPQMKVIDMGFWQIGLSHASSPEI